MKLPLLGLLTAMLALGQAPKSALDKKAMESYIRHLLLYPPQVQVVVGDPKPSEIPGFLDVNIHASAGQASEDRLFYVSKDGSKVLDAKVYDINKNPFQKDLERLKTDFQPSMGTPGAQVVIVLFSDFECSYCQQEAKALRGELLKTFPTQVRVYFKDMPLDQIHPWARKAAIAGRCVFRQKATTFWDFHDWIFEKQAEIKPENFDAKFGEWSGSKGLDAAQLASCRASKSTEGEVERSVAEAKALGVTSTPTLFINGRRLGGYVPWENLRQIIELEIGYQATAKNAGEQCCALPPLSPVKQ